MQQTPDWSRRLDYRRQAVLERLTNEVAVGGLIAAATRNLRTATIMPVLRPNVERSTCCTHNSGAHEIGLRTELPKGCSQESCEGRQTVANQVVGPNSLSSRRFGCKLDDERFSGGFSKFLEAADGKRHD
jgi:hypothetical protein